MCGRELFVVLRLRLLIDDVFEITGILLVCIVFFIVKGCGWL
jgi:hypothetical protein